MHGGEIFGIAGVSGNGQEELLAALSGEKRCAQRADAIAICWQAGRARLGPARRRALGLRFVPEERLGRGAVPAMSLAENALLTGAIASRWCATAGSTARRIARLRPALHRSASTCAAAATERRRDSLSGGNLQKFIVGPRDPAAPEVLVVAQPTWGVDVGAALLIRQALIDLRDAGVAVLVISEELEELFEICDRIAVLARGRLSPAVPAGRIGAGNRGAVDDR